MAELRVWRSGQGAAGLAWFARVILALSFACPLFGAPADYRVELTIVSEYAQRPFTHAIELNRRQYQSFHFRKEEMLREWLSAGRRAMALRQGFREDFHREDPAELVRVVRWAYSITERRTRKVLEQGANGIRTPEGPQAVEPSPAEPEAPPMVDDLPLDPFREMLGAAALRRGALSRRATAAFSNRRY